MTPAGRDLGLRVSISCDNRLMSRTSATAEFAQLAEHHGWTRADFIQTARIGLDSASVNEPIRERIGVVLSAAG